MFSIEDTLLRGSETYGMLPNGVYATIPIDDNFVKCIGGNWLNDANGMWISNILLANFETINFISSKVEHCILENFINAENGGAYWFIKICEEDDNLSELYGGITEEVPVFMFYVLIPYYIPESDTSSSTYSLRKTNLFDSLREKIEQMLDKSAE